MCLTRIYCRRKRDGRLFRFNSTASMLAYSRANHENRRTLPVIDRSEFIAYRDRSYDSPTWIRSTQYEGMAMLSDARNSD